MDLQSEGHLTGISRKEVPKSARKFDVRWKKKERITDVVTIASVETGILQEIHATTDDITSGEGRSIGNARSR